MSVDVRVGPYSGDRGPKLGRRRAWHIRIHEVSVSVTAGSVCVCGGGVRVRVRCVCVCVCV